MKKNTKFAVIIIAILVIVAIVGVVVWSLTNNTNTISYNELLNNLDEGIVKKIEIKNDVATVTFDDNSKKKVIVRDYLVQYITEKHDEWKENDKENEHDFELKLNDRNTGNIWNLLLTGLMILLPIIFLFVLFRRMGSENRQIMDFGKTDANPLTHGKVRFSDVAGADEEKEEIAEIVDFLRSSQKFMEAGARIPRGVLLVGPPGTGKTLLAKAVAGEADVPFFSMSGSDFVEMYVGVGASRVRSLFETAKKNKPCIIFIDEIDAVGRKRGAGLGGGHDEREQTLNQLLVHMDGFDTSDDIIVIAATNRADILDPALLRPGRFDRQIYVNYPDVKGREEIFKVHSRKKHLAAGIEFKTLARITSGFTGADIANLLNEAAILSVRENRLEISMTDIYEAINKVQMGPQKRSRVITEFDKRVTAYHESGHALVAKFIPNGDPVHEVSIIPRGSAAGYTSFRPENDNNHWTYNSLIADISCGMGGRAAEELVIKDISTGASADIQQCSKIARKMVTEWGMSELGPIFYGTSEEVFLGRDYGASHAYSDEIAGKIDNEVDKLISSCYEKAKQILTQHRDKMDTMARVLVECETIFFDEVNMIVEGKSASEVIEYIRGNKNRSPK